MDRESVRNGYIVIGDWTDAIMANVDVDLVIHMITLLEKYYPYGVKLDVSLDLPDIFKELVPGVIEHMTTLREVVVFMKSKELSSIIEEKNIPEHIKKKMI